MDYLIPIWKKNATDGKCKKGSNLGYVMAGITHIEIKENVEELEALVRQQKNARLKERV